MVKRALGGLFVGSSLRSRTGGEGVPCIGKAQEKACVPRTRKRIDPATGRASPEFVDSAAMVDACHIDVVGDDFGPCQAPLRSR